MAANYTLPTTSRVSGHLSLVAQNKLAFFERCAALGPVVRLRIYHVPVYVLSDADLIGQVLVEQPRAFAKTVGLQTMAKRLFGRGLLTSEGDLWRRQQRIVRPHFQPRTIQAYLSSIVECADDLVSSWKVGSVRDIHADLARVTLRIACRAIFGDDAWSARAAIVRATEAAQAFFMAWERHYLPFHDLLHLRETLEYRRAVAALDELIYALIARRRRMRAAAPDLLSVLVWHRDEEGGPLPDDLVRDEIITMFLASYETSSAAVAWTLYLVYTHPDVLRNTRAELARYPSGAGLGPRARELHYLHDVVREALRLYPSVPLIGRKALRPVDLGGHRVPRGAEVLMSPWAVHRSGRYWKDPARFVPERWAAQSDPEAKAVKHAYFPFGGGPRICTGQHLAMQEALLISATVLRRATLRDAVGSPPPLDPAVTMVPRAGTMRMTVEALAS
jgi:cytochrome P450